MLYIVHGLNVGAFRGLCGSEGHITPPERRRRLVKQQFVLNDIIPIGYDSHECNESLYVSCICAIIDKACH